MEKVTIETNGGRIELNSESTNEEIDNGLKVLRKDLENIPDVNNLDKDSTKDPIIEGILFEIKLLKYPGYFSNWENN